MEKASEVKTAGWDFVEENVQGLLQGELPDDQWKGMDRVRPSALPVTAANCLVPGSMKIVGPAADLNKLKAYMTNVLKRAKATGMTILVFGSGGARSVPEGFDRGKARAQILDFLRMSVPIAAQYGVTLVAEHLNNKECNIINSIAEAMEYVRAVNHPNFQCLADTFHFWTENEPLDSLKAAMPWIKHVHLSDKDGRVACGESRASDYRPFFRVLKQGGYSGMLSMEAIGFKDIAGVGPRALAFLRKQWNEA
jgi:sugar phosphate isomerase/epimerase